MNNRSICSNPFDDCHFLKDIKRSFIIREFLKTDNNKKNILSCTFKKEKNDVIEIIIKTDEKNIYTHKYIPKKLQNDEKHVNKKSINDKNKNNIKMEIDDDL